MTNRWCPKLRGDVGGPLLLVGMVAFLTGCASLQQEWVEPQRPAASLSGANRFEEARPLRSPQLDEGATIEDYVTYALINNSGLKSAFERWRAALAKVPQARSLPNPSLSYGYFIDSIETRVGPQRHRFELMQMIPFFGKLGLRGEAALTGAWAARARFEQAKLNLVYRVRDAYYESYYLGRAIEITRENLNVLTRLEEVASQKFRAGAAQQDVLKAQVELGKLRDRLESLQDMRGALAARLNAELNRPVHTSVPWPTGVKERALELPEEQILRLAQRQNWELKALSFEVEKSRKMLALSEKEFWPDFGLGVGYVVTGEARGGAMRPDDSGKDAVAAMLSVSLPVWRNRLHAGLREARAALAAAAEEKEQNENNLLSQVRFALYRYNDALRRVRLYGQTLIPKAQQALDASEAGYRAGKVDFVNVMDSERELLAFRLAYERALTEHQQRLAELERLVGGPLTRPVEEKKTEPAGVNEGQGAAPDGQGE